MIEQTCQWCGAAVSKRFCRPDTDVYQMLVFACGVEWYANSGMHAWSRKPTRECGQRCAEQMRRLRVVAGDTVKIEQLEQLGQSVNASDFAWDDATPWEIIPAVVRVAVDYVTKGD